MIRYKWNQLRGGANSRIWSPPSWWKIGPASHKYKTYFSIKSQNIGDPSPGLSWIKTDLIWMTVAIGWGKESKWLIKSKTSWVAVQTTKWRIKWTTRSPTLWCCAPNRKGLTRSQVLTQANTSQSQFHSASTSLRRKNRNSNQGEK